jgi:hypothetical protein
MMIYDDDIEWLNVVCCVRLPVPCKNETKPPCIKLLWRNTCGTKIGRLYHRYLINTKVASHSGIIWCDTVEVTKETYIMFSIQKVSCL